MNFQDDDETVIKRHTVTINDSFDVVCIRFQMRQSEFDLIKDGLKSDMEYFLDWLQPTPE